MVSTDGADLYTDEHNAAELHKAGADWQQLWIKAHLARTHSSDYVALLLAYIERDKVFIDALQKMRLAVPR